MQSYLKDIMGEGQEGDAQKAIVNQHKRNNLKAKFEEQSIGNQNNFDFF